MKKILILGGSRYIIPVINKIHELGYYAITCDYLPDNIAHKYSDEYYNVSIVEKDEVLELAKKIKIDGIMSFACDPGVETAYYVAEKLGLPGHPYKSVEILQNKAKFRKFLEENNFNVPKANGYNNIENAIKEFANYRLPVIVKPVDSAGSKGVTKVETLEELENAARLAIKFSKTKSFIVEEFIEKKGPSSDSDSFSVNGKLLVTTFSNQYFDERAINPYTPSAYSWPSEITIEEKNELENELQRLVSLLNLKTSIYNIETRIGIDGKAYIMEVSPRGGGNRLSEMIKYATGIDLIECSILAAIGEEIELDKQEVAYEGNLVEIILHAENDGYFDKITIDDKINEFLIEEDLWVKKGEIVHGFSGANEAIGTLVFNFKNKNQANILLENISSMIKVIVNKL